jgi:hypothetical protein
MDHRGEGSDAEYLVKWMGFGHKDDSWVKIDDFNGTEMIDKYWKKVRARKRPRKA